MKKMITIVTLLFMALFLVPCGTNVLLSQNKVLQPQKILRPIQVKPLVMKQRVMAYEALPIERITQKNARESLARLSSASSLDLKFQKVRNRKGRLLFTSGGDPSAVFDIDQKTGSFLLNYGLKKYAKKGTTKGLPANAQARKHLAGTGYLPKNERELVVAHVGGLNMAAAKDGRPMGTYKKLVTVEFSRVLNGMQVQGPGSRIIVHLGENGTMAGMIRNWSEVKAVGISASELKNDAALEEEKQERLRKLAGEARDVRVQKSKQVLYDDGMGRIEPAVHVVAEAFYEGPGNEGMVQIPVDFYVPLLKQPKALFPYMKSFEVKNPGGDKRQKTIKSLQRIGVGGKDRTDMK